MKTKNNIYILFALIWIITVQNLNAQQKSYILGPNESNISQVYEARDFIALKNGYSYIARPGETMQAKINSQLLLNTDYLQGSKIPDPKTFTPDKNLQFGSISGGLNVTQIGAATYTIPISCPPGIGKMVPQVTLTYSSQTGNGIAGIGFNISGLSVISRVPKDFYHEGYFSPIAFDNTDRFALDGNRLICTTVNYGIDGSLYHTENETFTIVKAHKETDTNGPDWFEVCTKDGIKLKYGKTTGKQVYTEGSKSTGVAWYLDYQEDPLGNFIEYNYEQRGLTLYIKKITYGSNNKDGSGTVANTIEFYYEIRSDVLPIVMGNLKGTSDLILNRIQTKTNNQLFREYSLEYISDNFSRLVKITESNGKEESLNPTTFKWGPVNNSPSSNSIKYYNYPADINTKNDSYLSEDLNGDGLTDILKVYNDVKNGVSLTYIKPYYAQTSINGTISFTAGTELCLGMLFANVFDKKCLETSFSFADMNGDNMNELIYYDSDGRYHILFFNLQQEWPSNYGGYITGLPLIGIFDGFSKGKGDILLVNKVPLNGHYYGRMITDPLDLSKRAYKDVEFKDLPNPKQMVITDANGDGMHDVIFAAENYINIYDGYSDTPKAKIPTSCSDYENFKQGDFNGDGLIDFVFNAPRDSNCYVAYSKGNFDFEIKRFPLLKPANVGIKSYVYDVQNYMVTNFNNDNKSDLIIFYEDHDKNSTFTGFDTYWYESDGTNFVLKNKVHSSKIAHSSIKYYLSGDFNGDGRQDLLNYGYNCLNSADQTADGWRVYSSFNSTFSEGLLTDVSDGLGNKSNITYRSLTVKDNYQVTSATNAYPLNTISNPLYVVKTVSSTNGVASNNITSYSYKDATLHRYLGFLGFGQVLSNNTITGTSVENNYSFLFEQGSVKKYLPYLTSSTTKIGTDVVQKTDNLTYELIDYPCKSFSFNQIGALTTDFTEKRKTQTTSTIDLNGNLYQQKTKIFDLDDHYVTANLTTNYYSDVVADLNDFASSPSQTSSVLVNSDETTNNDYESYTDFTYNDNGTLDTKTDYVYGHKTVTSSFHYDKFGNITSNSLSADGLKNRTSYYGYDRSGRFVNTRANSLGHTSTFEMDIWGNVLLSEDANHLKTYNTYDSWGNLAETRDPFNNKHSSSIKWVTTESEAINKSLYYTEEFSENVNVANSKVRVGAKYFDPMGRSLREITYSKTGAQLVDDYLYNAKGLMEEHDLPLPGTVPKRITYTYDTKNRMETQKSSAGITTTYNYYDSEKTKKVGQTLSTGEQFIKTYYATGLLKEATDDGGTITYNYRVDGKPETIVSPGGTTTIEYDAKGRQNKLTDPDAGATSYEYNDFGEVATQTNARGKVTTIVYDVLGRDSIRTSDGITTTYSYDSKGALGLIKSIISAEKGSSEFEYNTLAQLKTEKRGKGTQQFAYNYEYDSEGRLAKLIYPAGLTLTYAYNSYDEVTAIYNAAAPANPLWQLNDYNKVGLITKATYGNQKTIDYDYDSENRLTYINSPGIVDFGYAFNAKSQLETRGENSVYENFKYDLVNRLTTITDGSDTKTNLSITYQSVQNDRIKNKSDVGTYEYKSTSTHQLNYITANRGLVLPQYEITYTPENRVATLKQAIAGAETRLATFTYGVDDQRFSMEYKEGTTVKYTRYYFDNYEKEVNGDGSLKRHLNYIYAPTGLMAIYEQTPSDAKMHYIYTDYLGSLRCITDANGNIEQQLSYDAWGKRRDATTGLPLTSDPSNLMFARGYTGHEHLDEFGLINMNARVYDPALGMFLSPDNYVQAPDFTQNFNRYAYGMNNPMMYTDPSGNFAFIPFLAAMAIGGFQQAVANPNLEWNWGGFAQGAAMGAVTSGIGMGLGALYQPICSSFGIYSGFGQSLVAGGLGFLGAGANSFVTTGRWNWNAALVGGGIAFGIGVMKGIEDAHTYHKYLFKKDLPQLEGKYFRGKVLTPEEMKTEIIKMKGTQQLKKFKIRIKDDVPTGLRYDSKNMIYYDANGNAVGAFVSHRFFGGFDIRFSQAFTTNIDFWRGIVEHEFTHIYNSIYPKSLLKMYGADKDDYYSESAAAYHQIQYYQSLPPSPSVNSFIYHATEYLRLLQSDAGFSGSIPYLYFVRP
jgi:RHS repeat-associated protein